AAVALRALPARTHAAAPVRGRGRPRRLLIAFGSSISGAEAYRRYAEPGIRRAAEPDSQILAYAAVEPVARTYNLNLDAGSRLDETLLLGHGFDLDFSLELRQAGRRLVVENLEVIHHRPIELVGDLAVWVEAHIKLAEKWDGTLRDSPADEERWKRRARRAEA